MHLIVDQGNTRTKIALFQHTDLLLREEVTDENLTPLFTRIQREFNPQGGLISSVRQQPESTLEHWMEHFSLNSFDRTLKIPLNIKYESPNSLGTDRIANAVAGSSLYPATNVLVIDVGTCITYNIVSDHSFLGGAISMGLSMRFKALAHYTGRLPETNLEKNTPLVGRSTIESIRSGVQHGTMCEVDEMIENYCNRFPDLFVILTGGDVTFFERGLKRHIFADPNLTLKGLNEIYLLNKN